MGEVRIHEAFRRLIDQYFTGTLDFHGVRSIADEYFSNDPLVNENYFNQFTPI
jgi:hypothetical protein